MKRRMLPILAAAACSALVFATVALAATIRGTQGDDVHGAVDGTDGPDTIILKKGDDESDAGTGDDRVNAGKGDDVVDGSEDDDSLSGKAGTDTLNGDDGDDFLAGGRAVDDLDGGDDNDWIKGRGDGNAADNIICGAGTDTVKADKNDNLDGSCDDANVDLPGDGTGTKPSKPPHPSQP